MTVQIETFVWDGITIELTYEALKWGCTAHLEVRSIDPERAPLPIAETGYLSHFCAPGTIEANEGTLVEQVRAFLDERAKSEQWQAYLAERRQLSLF